MCVIIVSPAGQRIPSKNELWMAYLRNHDGCGFASDTQHYKSMYFQDFYEKLQKVPKSENVIIHFRLATHGSVGLNNCHPFYDEKSQTWFAHNGILDILPMDDMTDSETAFRQFFAPVIRRSGLGSQALTNSVFKLIGWSKFAFLRKGRIRLFGRFIKLRGNYYSNLYHLPLTQQVYGVPRLQHSM